MSKACPSDLRVWARRGILVFRVSEILALKVMPSMRMRDWGLVLACMRWAKWGAILLLVLRAVEVREGEKAICWALWMR